MPNRIEDFGEKIGGARKDIWKARGGLIFEDLATMTEEEIDKYCTKDNIWPRPDYKEMYNTGRYSPEKLMFLKMMYDSLPKKPYYPNSREIYINYIQAMRNVIMEEVGRHEEQFRDDMDQRDFFKYMLASTGIGFKDGRKSVVWNRENEYFVNGIVENKMLKAAQSSYEELTRKVDSTRFLITYKEQWLRSHQILNIDGDRVRIAEQSNGRVRLEVRSGYGVNFYYPKDIGEAKLGDWVIVKKDGASENCLPCESREKAVELSRVLAETFEATCEKLLHDSKGNSAKYIKQKYNPITIENPIREGAECLRGLDVEGDDYLKTFKFRGGEFGNWLNGKERQITLNAGYEGLMDLAQALGVTPESIGLGGKLAIAFGARGHGNALAHYEKLLNVINLTKMKGSGALAHEYGHAMDFYLRANGHEDWVRDVVKVMQFKKVEVESKVDQEKAFDKAFNNAKSWLTYSRPWYNMDDIQRDKALEILKECLRNSGTEKGHESVEIERMTMISGYARRFGKFDADESILKPLNDFCKEVTSYNLVKETREHMLGNMSAYGSEMLKMGKLEERTVKTDYYKDSEEMDEKFAKTGQGYWRSGEEMFARGFACYVADKLGCASDYLCGLAYDPGIPVPKGEEKEAINQKFDELLEKMKDAHLMERGQVDYDAKLKEAIRAHDPTISDEQIFDALNRTDADGILMVDTIVESQGVDYVSAILMQMDIPQQIGEDYQLSLGI